MTIDEAVRYLMEIDKKYQFEENKKLLFGVWVNSCSSWYERRRC